MKKRRKIGINRNKQHHQVGHTEYLILFTAPNVFRCFVYFTHRNSSSLMLLSTRERFIFGLHNSRVRLLKKKKEFFCSRTTEC